MYLSAYASDAEADAQGEVDEVGGHGDASVYTRDRDGHDRGRAESAVHARRVAGPDVAYSCHVHQLAMSQTRIRSA